MIQTLLLCLAVALAALFQDPGDIATRFNRAVELQRLGAFEEAEREYRALLERAPNYAEAHANLGAVLMRRGRYQEAVAAYDSALRLNPGLTPVLLNLGIAHYRQGEFEKAAGALQQFLSKEPNHVQALQLAGLSLIELDRAVEAVELLKRALALEPTSAEIKSLVDKVNNNYVGSASCTPCHKAHSDKQLASNMAKAAFAPEEHPLFDRFKNQTARVMGLRFLFLGEKKPFQISISDDTKEATIPAQWAFGAGVHGVTFFSRLGPGKYLEHLLSYYPRKGGLDFTPGQGERKFAGLADAAGHANDRAEAFRCLSCHTTGTRNPSGTRDIAVGELGVRCESCHGHGSLHLEAVKAEKWEEARSRIENPRRYTATQILEQCGTCHRAPPHDPSQVDWTDAANTRFQPIGLSQSRCFKESKGALSCLTCHDAHTDARRGEPAFYAAICASCHNATKSSPVHASAVGNDCVSCHMPRVQAMRHLDFANHWIGIFPATNKLVPRRE